VSITPYFCVLLDSRTENADVTNSVGISIVCAPFSEHVKYQSYLRSFLEHVQRVIVDGTCWILSSRSAVVPVTSRLLQSNDKFSDSYKIIKNYVGTLAIFYLFIRTLPFLISDIIL
jgi:hypothetical protein